MSKKMIDRYPSNIFKISLIVISLSLVSLIVPLQSAYGAAVAFNFPDTPIDGLLGSNTCGGSIPCATQVAVSVNNVYVLWQEFFPIADPKKIKIRSSTDSGLNFGSETTLGTGNTKTINNGINVIFGGTPDLAVSGNNVYAVWHDDGTIQFNEGTNFANAAINLSGNTGIAVTPQVATPGSDDVYVVWYNNTHNEISSKASNNKGLDFNTVNIKSVGNTTPLPSTSFPNPQIAASGNYVNVVWSSDVDILLSTSTNKGDWFGFKEIQIDDENIAAIDPQIASSGNNVYVVWQQNNKIQFSTSIDNGETFSVPEDLNTVETSASPQIAIAGDNVYVTWEGSTKFAFSNNNGQTFVTKQLDAGELLQDQSPHIAAEGTNVAVVWVDKTLNSGGDVLAQVSSDSGASFELVATPAGDIGNNFQSIDPSVVISGNKIFTAWQDNGLPLFKIGTIGGPVVAFDQSQYKIGGTATITVNSTDPNHIGAGMISVDVTSSSEPGKIVVLLDEDPSNLGQFEGTVTFVDGVSVQANAELHAETGPTGDVITATFGNGATATIFPVDITRMFLGGTVTGTADYGEIDNFEVSDPNANSDVGVEEEATIDVTSLAGTVSIPLKESDTDTGIFTEDTKNDNSLAELIYMTGPNLVPTSGDVNLSQNYTEKCDDDPVLAFCDLGVINNVKMKITSTSDDIGFVLQLNETGIDTRIFEGTFSLTEDPSADTSIQVKLGDVVELENQSTSEEYIDNLFVTPDANTNVVGSKGAIQVALFSDNHDGEDITASYKGAEIEWRVRDGLSKGGGGGGLVRPGLVVNVLAGAGSIAGFFGGGGGNGPNAPTVMSSTFTIESQPSFTQLAEGIASGSSTTEIKLDDSSGTQVIKTGDPLKFRLNIYENGGINNLEHATLYFFDGGIELNQYNLDVTQSDTYILFDVAQSVHVIDPHGYFANADFELLEKDAWNLIINYDITFAKPMDTSSMLLRTWDLDRNTSDKIFQDIIKVVDYSGVQTNLIETNFENVESSEPQDIPIWVKNNAAWWEQKQISDSDFIAGIEYLINQNIIKIQQTEATGSMTADEIPDWIRNVAGFWANDSISNTEFISSMQWLISNGVMVIV